MAGKDAPQQLDSDHRHEITPPLDLGLPIQIDSASKYYSRGRKSNVKTNADLILFRMLEHGIAFDEFQTVHQVQQALERFRADLFQSGCFNHIQVNLVEAMPSAEEDKGPTDGNDPLLFLQKQQQVPHRLQVILDEKNWYRLYIGGGIKHGLGGGDDSSSQFTLDVAPSVQMETSLGLINLTGCLDTTTLQYTVDQRSSSTWNLIHERPLYTMFPNNNIFSSSDSDYHRFKGMADSDWWWRWCGLRNYILSQPMGSQYTFSIRAALETMDFDFTRSYKEFQRLFSIRLANKNNKNHQPCTTLFNDYFMGFEWNVLFRDIIPIHQLPKQTSLGSHHRHLLDSHNPFALTASPEIVLQAGPSIKHSFLWEYRRNRTDNRFNPTHGTDLSIKTELATPPGDVGFWKIQGGLSMHQPMMMHRNGTWLATKGTTATVVRESSPTYPVCCCHATVSMGWLYPLLFGGVCNPPTVSDRFFCGGPMQLRGFLPGGIGPRSNNRHSTIESSITESNTPNGDALGGDVFYMATLATSVGGLSLPSAFVRDHVRLFAFVNAGTLAGLHHLGSSNNMIWTFLQSSRVAVGAGCSVAIPAGRLELTYSVPLRYSPRDARRSFQFGFGFSLG